MWQLRRIRIADPAIANVQPGRFLGADCDASRSSSAAHHGHGGAACRRELKRWRWKMHKLLSVVLAIIMRLCPATGFVNQIFKLYCPAFTIAHVWIQCICVAALLLILGLSYSVCTVEQHKMFSSWIWAALPYTTLLLPTLNFRKQVLPTGVAW